MKILITGAAGFIASHLSERLALHGHEVYGIDNFSDYYSRSLKEENVRDIKAAGVHFIEGDLAQDLFTLLPSDIEVIYHLAAQPGISATTSFELYERNNIVATQNLLQYALQLDNSLKSFVNIATSSVYGIHATSTEVEAPKPVSDYGVTKLAAEQLIMAAQRSGKINACSLRLFSVYGPRERPEKLYTKLIKSIVKNTSFPLFKGSENHERSFTYVGDIVDGLVAILKTDDLCNGQIINLGTDTVHTTGEGIAIIEDILNTKANLKVVDKRPGDQLKTSATIDLAKKLLQYDPKTTLQKGLQAQVDWYLEKFT